MYEPIINTYAQIFNLEENKIKEIESLNDIFKCSYIINKKTNEITLHVDDHLYGKLTLDIKVGDYIFINNKTRKIKSINKSEFEEILQNYIVIND